MSFRDIALPLIQKNVPVIPLRPKTKIAFLDHWEAKATTDINQIDQWNAEYPDSNCASVALAKPGDIWILELDSVSARQRIIDENPGQNFPPTFAVRSSPGRGHFYFKQTEASIAMGNIAQGFVKGGDWSARVDRQYVVSPGSIHPRTGEPYEIRLDAPIIPAPEWLLNWCVSQKVEKASAAVDDGSPIIEGNRNTRLTSIAGRLRHAGLDRPQLLSTMLSINENQCKPPLPVSEIETLVGSISRYDVGKDTTVTIGGRVAGDVPVQIQPGIVPAQVLAPAVIQQVVYPEFPRWVMKGTSIYEGFCKPICDKNTRYPEFMFMPAVTLMLNYLSTRVRIAQKNFPLSLYMCSIGKRGFVIKSSSVKDALAYMQYVGIADADRSTTRNAEGKSIVYTVGSLEALGIDMQAKNCRNAVLFYDELSHLISKAGIESSSMNSYILELYESNGFQNKIKNGKQSFTIEGGTYCFSLITCSTDKKFNQDWGRLTGGDSGLNDRFFFLYQPKVLMKPEPMVVVPFHEAAAVTRQLIDKAVEKGVYAIDDMLPLSKQSTDMGGNRPEIRAEKLALYFAIDLGLDSIDEDCVERAIALIKYERQVKKYLHLKESFTKEAALQNHIIDIIRQNGGRMNKRELSKSAHPARWGTQMWGQAYRGLLQAGWMGEMGDGVKGSGETVYLTDNAPINDDEDED